MTERVLVRTWYQSYTQNGRLWTEATSPDEVVREALKHEYPSTLTFSKFEVYETVEGPLPWAPDLTQEGHNA